MSAEFSPTGFCAKCRQNIFVPFSDHVFESPECGHTEAVKSVNSGAAYEPSLALRAPFPWFGGKSRAAGIIWPRLGRVANYVEPFFGSGAVLLARPHKAGNEIVNDRDCYVSNAWRAIKSDPETTAQFADAPVNEADLHARHRWLHAQSEFRERMMTEPEFYDAKIAGWWIWGLSCWIGGNFCRPNLTGDQGVTRQVPRLTGDQGVTRKSLNLINWFSSLSNRLRFTKICCGDWTRVVTKAATWGGGLTAIVLDPPYDTDDHDDVYGALSRGVSATVRDWAIENGDNKLLRIALCGYENEHSMPSSWKCVAWKAGGGYGNQSGNQNANRERIWFSPPCLNGYGPLFDGANA